MPRPRRCAALAVLVALSGCLTVADLDRLAPAPGPVSPASPVLPPRTEQSEHLVYDVLFLGVPIGRLVLETEHGALGSRIEIRGGTHPWVDLVQEVRGWARSTEVVDEATRFDFEVALSGGLHERSISFGRPVLVSGRGPGLPPVRGLPVAALAPIDPLRMLPILRDAADDMEAIDSEIVIGARVRCYRATRLGRASVEVAAGTFVDAIHWRIEDRPVVTLVPEMEVGEPERAVELYFSADARHLPVLLTRELLLGSVRVALREVARSRPVTAAGAGSRPAARVAGSPAPVR